MGHQFGTGDPMAVTSQPDQYWEGVCGAKTNIRFKKIKQPQRALKRAMDFS